MRSLSCPSGGHRPPLQKNKGFVLAAVLVLSACTHARSLQIRPPETAPPGLISGYGIAKVSGNLDQARSVARLKALNELLTHSASADRLLQSTFPARASQLLQPAFERSGADRGLVWVVLATTEDEI